MEPLLQEHVQEKPESELPFEKGKKDEEGEEEIQDKQPCKKSQKAHDLPSSSSAPLQVIGRPFVLWPRTDADEIQQVKQCSRCIDLGLPHSALMLALKHPWETAAMVETLTEKEVLGLLEAASDNGLRQASSSHCRAGILSRFAAMFEDVEENTHLRASELLAHLGRAEDSA